MKIINPIKRDIKDVGVTAVWDRRSTVLFVGSMMSRGGQETGFFYGSPPNQFWELLDLALDLPETDAFLPLKKELLANYKAYHTGTIPQTAFEARRKDLQERFIAKLLNCGIAVCDILQSCYCNNGGSSDTDIILSDPEHYPYVTNEPILREILATAPIKKVIVTSRFVEKQFLKLQIEGDYTVQYAVSPSPRRGTIDEKKEMWKGLLR